MTNYIILVLCLIIILAYIFDITSRYTKIPGVILLIFLGIFIHIVFDETGLKIPNLKPALPVIGTIGLILIVLEASLDLKLERKKAIVIGKSVLSAISLFMIFVACMSFIMVKFMHRGITESLLNAIPFGVISSAVAISASVNLTKENREFIVYESSFSDILGILVFDFVLVNKGPVLKGIFNTFILGGAITLIISLAVTSALAILLYKSRYHVSYIIILTVVIMVYALAKIIHLPALLLVLVFGLVMANNRMVENTPLDKYVDFRKFRNDLESFKRIIGELTFLIRSFFFIMFGFYASLEGFLNFSNIITSLAITGFVFLLRWLFIEIILRMPVRPLVFFAPRGLITILLFLNIPAVAKVPFLSEEVITLVILMTIAVLTAGNMIYKPENENTQPAFVPDRPPLPDEQILDGQNIYAVNNSGEGNNIIINEDNPTTSDS